MHLLMFDPVMFGRHYIRIHLVTPLGKTDRDLCQKRQFHDRTLRRFHQKCAALMILLLCFCCFLILMYCVVLNRFDLPEFVEIHPNMTEDGSKTLCCANHQQFYFWLPTGARNTLYLSNILQTSVNTLNLSVPFFCGLPCFESSSLFWHIKHSFGSKVFFIFLESLSMGWTI